MTSSPVARWSARLVFLLTLAAGKAEGGTPADRYSVDAAEDTVSDTRTGLIWQRTVSSTSYTWADAQSVCTARGGAWRLPTVKELLTLVDVSRVNPSIDPTAFPGTPAAPFWSSSPYVGASGGAWDVDFSNGGANGAGTSFTSRVRCVR